MQRKKKPAYAVKNGSKQKKNQSNERFRNRIKIEFRRCYMRDFFYIYTYHCRLQCVIMNVMCVIGVSV